MSNFPLQVHFDRGTYTVQFELKQHECHRKPVPTMQDMLLRTQLNPILFILSIQSKESRHTVSFLLNHLYLILSYLRPRPLPRPLPRPAPACADRDF